MQHHDPDEGVKNELMRCGLTAHYLPALSRLCSIQSRCIKKKRRRKTVSFSSKNKANIHRRQTAICEAICQSDAAEIALLCRYTQSKVPALNKERWRAGLDFYKRSQSGNVTDIRRDSNRLTLI